MAHEGSGLVGPLLATGGFLGSAFVGAHIGHAAFEQFRENFPSFSFFFENEPLGYLLGAIAGPIMLRGLLRVLIEWRDDMDNETI